MMADIIPCPEGFCGLDSHLASCGHEMRLSACKGYAGIGITMRAAEKHGVPAAFTATAQHSIDLEFWKEAILNNGFFLHSFAPKRLACPSEEDSIKTCKLIRTFTVNNMPIPIL